MFKNLAGIASLMRNANQIGEKFQGVNEQLKSQRATGEAGGGMVKVEVNGQGEMLKLHIEPALFDRGEREIIEDLIPAAVNQAIVKAKKLHAEAMANVAKDFHLPGVEEALAKFTGDLGDAGDSDEE